MSKRTLKALCHMAMIVTFITGLYSTFYFKQLIRDGSPWAFRLFNMKNWVIDEPFSRYSSMIVQTPAVLAARLGGDSTLVNWLYCLGYFIYPFLAAFCLYIYLRRKNRSELIFPLYLTFFVAIVPSWAFANAISSEAIVIFWILYCYIIAEEKPKTYVISILSVLLFLSYESGIIFYALSTWILWREKKLRKAHLFIFGLLSILQVYNFFFIIMPGRGHKFFAPSVGPGLTSPFIILIPSILISFFLLGIKKEKAKILGITIAVLSSGWVLYEIWSLIPRVLWNQSYNNRVWGIPVAFLLMLVSYEVFKLQRFKISRATLGLFVVFCLPGLLHELKLIDDSKELVTRLKEVSDKKEGCVVLSLEEQKKLRGDSYLPVWDLPYLSMVLQKQRKIEALLINDYVSDKPKIICQISQDKNHFEYSDQWTVYKIYLKGNYDFSLLFKGK